MSSAPAGDGSDIPAEGRGSETEIGVPFGWVPWGASGLRGRLGWGQEEAVDRLAAWAERGLGVRCVTGDIGSGDE